MSVKNSHEYVKLESDLKNNKITKTQQVQSNDDSGIVQENTISMCAVLKSNTSKIIKKLEFQIPSNFQHYSDLYSEYLHLLDDTFGTCYLAEKEFFDKLGFDQRTLKMFDEFMNTITDNVCTQIEFSSDLLRSYTQIRISAIKSYDTYVHIYMNVYANMLSQFNAYFAK